MYIYLYTHTYVTIYFLNRNTDSSEEREKLMFTWKHFILYPVLDLVPMTILQADFSPDQPRYNFSFPPKSKCNKTNRFFSFPATINFFKS